MQTQRLCRLSWWTFLRNLWRQRASWMGLLDTETFDTDDNAFYAKLKKNRHGTRKLKPAFEYYLVHFEDAQQLTSLLRLLVPSTAPLGPTYASYKRRGAAQCLKYGLMSLLKQCEDDCNPKTHKALCGALRENVWAMLADRSELETKCEQLGLAFKDATFQRIWTCINKTPQGAEGNYQKGR